MTGIPCHQLNGPFDGYVAEIRDALTTERPPRQSWYVPAWLGDQLAVVAKDSGYTMEAETWDGQPGEWMFVEFDDNPAAA